MFQEKVERNLKERTGRHYCISCLHETPAEQYFANDHVCDACAALDQAIPLAATPDAKPDPDTPARDAEAGK
ncbi:MAG TPA: hypothetical protein VMS12_07810 [Thermoanaerobaculia bacterium]|nr:hypothetical protein [Thermoanaerobaculia bacterium]